MGELEAVLRRTICVSYPELKGLRIELRPLEGEGYFLEARPDLKTLFRSRRDRVYAVYAARELLLSPPSESALRGVLAHELEHVSGYARMGARELALLGVDFLFGREARVAAYERSTDEGVLRRCLGAGLRDYRLWAEPRTPPKARLERARRYFSPVEIERWMEFKECAAPRPEC